MKGRILTAKILVRFKKYLLLKERSAATVEKYLRDARAFIAFANGAEITKELVIGYKKHLQENYAVRSVNSMLASINSLFAFLGWLEFNCIPTKKRKKFSFGIAYFPRVW